MLRLFWSDRRKGTHYGQAKTTEFGHGKNHNAILHAPNATMHIVSAFENSNNCTMNDPKSTLLFHAIARKITPEQKIKNKLSSYPLQRTQLHSDLLSVKHLNEPDNPVNN